MKTPGQTANPPEITLKGSQQPQAKHDHNKVADECETKHKGDSPTDLGADKQQVTKRRKSSHVGYRLNDEKISGALQELDRKRKLSKGKQKVAQHTQKSDKPNSSGQAAQ